MRNKILIVDDVDINRELLAEMLDDEHEILMAEKGEEAVRILKADHEQIALLMLDLVMPVMDGFTVLKELQKLSWSKDIGIIIISSDTAVQTETDCFDLGAADFVHRPFNNRLH